MRKRETPCTFRHILRLYFFVHTTAYSHEFFVRGQRYLCEFMERRKHGISQFSKVDKGSKPTEAKLSSEASSMPGSCMPHIFHDVKSTVRSPPLDNSFIQPVSLITPSSMQAFAPIVNISSKPARVQGACNNIYHSFMNQEWEDLPSDTTPSDVVSEIIATFRTA